MSFIKQKVNFQQEKLFLSGVSVTSGYEEDPLKYAI